MTNKQNQLTFILFVFIALIIACQQPTNNQDMAEGPSNEEVTQTILEMERAALDQWSNGDPTGYAMHAAEGMTYFDDIGAQNRIEGAGDMQKYLEGLEGNIPPHDYEIIDPMVQVFDDIAILTMHYHSRMDTIAGTPWKATSVYHRNDSTWEVVHANWSLVKQEQ